MASERLEREFRHVLRRCPGLLDAEVRFLALVASYSQGCLLNYEEICLLTSWSRSKLARTIRSLEKRGLIEIKYRSYKKTTIKIAPAWRQVEFAEAFNVSSMTQELYVTDEALMSHPRNHDVSPMTHSTLERELERNLEKGNMDNSEKDSLDVSSLISIAFPGWRRKMLRSI